MKNKQRFCKNCNYPISLKRQIRRGKKGINEIIHRDFCSSTCVENWRYKIKEQIKIREKELIKLRNELENSYKIKRVK